MSAPSGLLGHTLGHYRIVEQIGAGGMGIVYRAHDEQLERDAAVKNLRWRNPPTGLPVAGKEDEWDSRWSGSRIEGSAGGPARNASGDTLSLPS